MSWQRAALLSVGIAQLTVASMQGFGLSLGLAQAHGTLLHESTSWSVALGVMMVATALRPAAAAGLAGVLAVFTSLLTAYVVIDAFSGVVTLIRILTHLPLLIGAVLAIVVWRSGSIPTPIPEETGTEPDIVLPPNASRGRRRGHLRPAGDTTA